MKKFFEYLENYLDTFNNNYVLSESDISLRKFIVNNDFKNTEDKTLNLDKIKEEITKIIKTNDKNEEYILKKDFTELKEKYDFDNKSNKIPDDLKEKVKLYKRNSEKEIISEDVIPLLDNRGIYIDYGKRIINIFDDKGNYLVAREFDLSVANQNGHTKLGEIIFSY